MQLNQVSLRLRNITIYTCQKRKTINEQIFVYATQSSDYVCETTISTRNATQSMDTIFVYVTQLSVFTFARPTMLARNVSQSINRIFVYATQSSDSTTYARHDYNT